MQNLFKQIKATINGTIISFVASGLILIMAAILIVWTDFFLRLVIGLFVIVVAYMFFYLAFKTWQFKKAIEKYLKL
jgi:ABC-type bacteriocin/lantibiotic exporter with double-glycine peptidase domain